MVMPGFSGDLMDVLTMDESACEDDPSDDPEQLLLEIIVLW